MKPESFFNYVLYSNTINSALSLPQIRNKFEISFKVDKEGRRGVKDGFQEGSSN